MSQRAEEKLNRFATAAGIWLGNLKINRRFTKVLIRRGLRYTLRAITSPNLNAREFHMQGIGLRSAGLSLFVLAAVSLTFAEGHPSKATRAAMPLPTDWSHRHLVFSQPTTAENAVKVQRDTRYQLQLQQHELRPTATLRGKGIEDTAPARRHHRRGRRMHRDWSWDLGAGAKVGPAFFPAKFAFNVTTAQCGLAAQPDYVVFGTGVTPTGSQGSITAVTNLYSGCGGQVPANYWNYNTGGIVATSPVLSLDGTQVAFVQKNGLTSSLVLLRWHKFDGTIVSTVTPTSVLSTSYFGCTAPCMTSFPLTVADTNSSVFYDYGSDTAFVGDDTGLLHQYSGVFKGTPAEVVGGGWPAIVSTGAALTSPVHDGGSGITYVADKGGFVYRVDSSGAPTKSGQLDFGGGFTEGPIVDPSAGMLYVSSSKDALGTSAGVFQLSTTFGAGTTGTEVKVGAATSGTTPIFNGAFDHNYLNGTAPTGNFYVCGNPGGQPTIYQIPINNNVMGTALLGPVIGTTGTTPCSPITDVYNASVTGAGLPQEWVFASVQGAGTPDPCGGFSCVMNFKVTSWQPNFVYNTGQEVLDSNLSIQVAENPLGVSGAAPPAWNSGVFATTMDGGVHWRSQGKISAQSPGSWVANTFFSGGQQIVDTNNNIEIQSFLGGATTGGTQPVWPLVEGTTTNDGSVIWYNLGANPSAALQAQGGTSGIIIDNTVVNPGGSQVYFSTQQDGGCFTSGGTGGCAVQASQQGLN